MNRTYEHSHLAFENNFWSTKMGLKGASTDDLAQTKTDYETFLAVSSAPLLPPLSLSPQLQIFSRCQ